MKNETRVKKAGEDYSAAYAMHYGAKNVGEASELYQRILIAHPDTQETEYSRSQIQSIVKAVFTEQELLDLQVALAAASFAPGDPSLARPAGSTPIVSGIPS